MIDVKSVKLRPGYKGVYQLRRECNETCTAIGTRLVSEKLVSLILCELLLSRWPFYAFYFSRIYLSK